MGSTGSLATGPVLAVKDLPSENAFENLLAQTSKDNPSAKPPMDQGANGFRVCRDCRAVILRGQYMMEEGDLPEYLRLYEVSLGPESDATRIILTRRSLSIDHRLLPIQNLISHSGSALYRRRLSSLCPSSKSWSWAYSITTWIPR